MRIGLVTQERSTGRTTLATNLGLLRLRAYCHENRNIAGYLRQLAENIPAFEVACGLLLLWSPSRRIGALGVFVISTLFLTTLWSALRRGLTPDCGCFGVAAPSRTRIWLELGLDAALAGGSVLICLRSIVGPLLRAP
jgi:hypothetical protein